MSFEVELVNARKRLEIQTKALNDCREGFAEAVRRGLNVTAQSYKARIVRYEAAVRMTEGVVRELESAVKPSPQVHLEDAIASSKAKK